MSLKRFATQRDANESEIVQVLRKAGASVELIDTPCDLLVGVSGETMLVEVKTEKGAFTKPQKEFHKRWKGNYVVVVTIDQALKVVADLRQLAAIRNRCGRHSTSESGVNNADPTNDQAANP